jgi:hypothetical protein
MHILWDFNRDSRVGEDTYNTNGFSSVNKFFVAVNFSIIKYQHRAGETKRIHFRQDFRYHGSVKFLSIERSRRCFPREKSRYVDCCHDRYTFASCERQSYNCLSSSPAPSPSSHGGTTVLEFSSTNTSCSGV